MLALYFFASPKKVTKKEPAIDDSPMAEGSLIKLQYYCKLSFCSLVENPKRFT